jgi:hypothetical protein
VDRLEDCFCGIGTYAMMVAECRWSEASRWSDAETKIAYHDMQRLSAARISGQRFLYIQHPGGKYTITSSMLPSKNAFDEVRQLLSAKIDGARPR